MNYKDFAKDGVVAFARCIRVCKKIESTINFPLPPDVTPDTLVDYVGNEFNWQFIPIEVVPVALEDLSND